MNHIPQSGNASGGTGTGNSNSNNNSSLNQQQFQEMMYNSFLNHLNQNKPASGSSGSGSNNAASGNSNTSSGNNATAAALAQQQKYLSSQPQRYYSNPSANMMNDPLAQQSFLQQQQQQMLQQHQLHQMQGGQSSTTASTGNNHTTTNSANYSPQYMHDQLQYHPSGNGSLQYNSNGQPYQYHPQNVSYQQNQQKSSVAQYNQVNQDQSFPYQQQYNQQNMPNNINMQQAQLKAQQRTLQLNQDGTPKVTKKGKGRKPKKQDGAAPTKAPKEPAASQQQGNNANHPKKLSSTQSRIEKRKQLKKQGPKRPSSAYFLFSMSIRNELLQQFPDAKVPELSKLASARWRELSDDEKKPYYDEFRTNWEKYRVLRDEYEKTLPPKRPSGPFIQFTQEIRPIVVKENPDKNLIEITKIIGSKWRDLDPAKKNEYTEMYKQRLKEWEECYPEEAAAHEQSTQTKKGRKKKQDPHAQDNTAITDPSLLNAGNISVGVADLSSMVPKMDSMQ